MTTSDAKEPTFNLYLFMGADGIVTELGAVRRDQDGTDNQKAFRLLAESHDDARKCVRFPVPARYGVYLDGRTVSRRTTWLTFRTLFDANLHLDLFDEVLTALGSGPHPYTAVTPVVDGVIRDDDLIRCGPEA